MKKKTLKVVAKMGEVVKTNKIVMIRTIRSKQLL